MYQTSKDKALIATLDIITPVCDDPYRFGQIAAANALSDVYAMGGEPRIALNICCFPITVVDKHIFSQILEGGLSKIHEAGAFMAGGHSIKDTEIKYGISLVGEVHPEKIWKNNTPHKNDVLILTKPIGTGVGVSAFKKDKLSEKDFEPYLENMAQLNRYAYEVLKNFTVHAVTDVTGFGLAGHGFEMVGDNPFALHIELNKIPVYEKSLQFMKEGLRIGGTITNEFATHDKIDRSRVKPEMTWKKDILFDPQTSGGFLISTTEEEAQKILPKLHQAGYKSASIIGKVVARKNAKILLH